MLGCRSSIRYGGMVCCDRDRVGSIRRTAAPPRGGGQTGGDRAPGHVRARSRRLPAARVEGTDVPVAQLRVSQTALAGVFCAASTAAHRTRVEPCLVIGLALRP